jgi:hypothetical protein
MWGGSVSQNWCEDNKADVLIPELKIGGICGERDYVDFLAGSHDGHLEKLGNVFGMNDCVTCDLRQE